MVVHDCPPQQFVKVEYPDGAVSGSPRGRQEIKREGSRSQRTVWVTVTTNETAYSPTILEKRLERLRVVEDKSADRLEIGHNFRMEAMSSIDDTVKSGTWQDKGWPAPNLASVAHAKRVIDLLSQSAIPALRSPFVSSDYEGCVTMEWWNDPKKVTLCIYSAPRIDFLKSWGEDISTEMEDGETENPLSILEWLYEERATTADETKQS